MKDLTSKQELQIIGLGKAGLSVTGQAFLTNFALAEMNGRGIDNRQVLSVRLRRETEEQQKAALNLFDQFVNDRK